MSAENVFKVIGIKKVFSKDKTRIYTSYYCLHDFSTYEVDNAALLAGVPCEEVQTTEDFDIGIGDKVKFYYGKARGDWQPVVDFQMVEKAGKASKAEPNKKTEPPASAKK